MWLNWQGTREHDNDAGVTPVLPATRGPYVVGLLPARNAAQDLPAYFKSIAPVVDMVVALLSILKAGAAYVPLDPAYPTARLRAIIAT